MPLRLGSTARGDFFPALRLDRREARVLDLAGSEWNCSRGNGTTAPLRGKPDLLFLLAALAVQRATEPPGRVSLVEAVHCGQAGGFS